MTARRKRPRPAKVVLTERALSDLREIESYSVRNWDRKTADSYFDAIQSALDLLKENRSVLSEGTYFAPGLYFYRVRKHFLVCDYADDVVIVLTVIHTSMDIPTRLAELAPQLATEAEFLHEKLRKKL